MLTGSKVFEGEDVSLTLSSVLQREPNWGALPTDTPPLLTTFLRGCLQKDPRQRVRDIGDVRLAMEGAFEMTVTTPSNEAVAQRAGWQPALPWAALALVAVLALAVSLVFDLQP